MTEALPLSLLNQCIERRFVAVPSNTLLVDVLQQMSQAKSNRLATSPPHLEGCQSASCVLVQENGQLVGVLTERDIVRLIANGRFAEHTVVASVMTRHVITVLESEVTDHLDLLQRLRHHRIRHLPIVDAHNRPTGLVTPTSIRAALQPAELLKCRYVGEVMSETVIHAPSRATGLELAQLMAQHQVSCVVIGSPTPTGAILPIGIVTERDVVHWQAHQLNLQELQAEQIMSAPLHLVQPEDSLWSVHQAMQQRNIRRLVVVNTNGELAGIVTQTSVLQAIDPSEMHQVIAALHERVQVLQSQNGQLLQQLNQDLQEQVDVQTLQLADQSKHQQLLLDVALRIRLSLNLQTILQTAVIEVRHLLQTDRVLVYRFAPDWSGWVTVESVAQPQWSILHQTVQDECFDAEWLKPFQEQKSRAIDDIYAANFSECYLQFLEKFQVRANLAVPIDVNGSLWGLLIAHHCTAPRHWLARDVEALEKLSIHLAIAIQQANLLEQVQQATQELESRVAKRTIELQHANRQLQRELDERQQAEARSLEREQVLRSFYDSSPMMMGVVELLDDDILHISDNATTAQFLGSKPIEMAYKRASQLGVPREFIEGWISHYRQSQHTQTPVRFEYQHYREDGMHWLSATVSFIGIAESGCPRFSYVVEDITDRKRVEDDRKRAEEERNQTAIALSASEATKQALIEALPDLLIRMHRDGTYLDVEAREGFPLRVPREQMKGNNLRNVIPLADAEYRLQLVELALETRQLQEYKFPLEVQGKMRWQEVRIVPINTDDVLVVIRDITEQYQAEQALRESEEKFRQLAENIHQVFFILSNQGQFLYISPAYEQIWARPCQSLFERPETWAESLHPDDRSRITAALTHQLRSGGIFDETFRIIRPDGEIRWIASRSFPLPDKAGQVTRFTGIAEDITQQKQAEDTIQRELQKAVLLRHITNQIRQSLDAEQIFETAARQIGEAFQASRCLIHIYVAEPEEAVPFAAEYLLGDCNSIRHLNLPIHNNQHLRLLLSQEHAIASDNVYTDPLLSVCTALCQDIELKSMLAIGTFYQGKPNGAICLHQCDRYRQWTDDEIELIEALASQLGLAIAQASLLKQEVQQRQELTLKNLELSTAKQAADTANRAKSEFLANMSHEIRTPMNAVLGFSDLLQSIVIDPQAKSYLDAIASSGKTLMALINDILDLSKIEAGKLQLHYEPIDVRSLIQEIQQIFLQAALDKGLQLKTAIDPAVPLTLHLDEVRLRQILFNVVGNALKFTDRGEICITARMGESVDAALGDRYLEISVIDTGIGIAPHNQSTIFEAFTQSDGQSTRKYGGTGLGLTITQRLVQIMGGTITLVSQPGHGSTFTFRFPQRAVGVAQSSLAPATAPSYDTDLNQFQPSRILIVDDVRSNRDLLCSFFAGTAHQLLIAQDGREAIELAQAHQPDVVLLDLRMPGLDGRQVAQILKCDNSTQHIPIVVLTASSQLIKQTDWQPLCQGVLQKPISRSQLVAELKKVLKQVVSDRPSPSSNHPASHEVATSPTPAAMGQTPISVPELLTKMQLEMNTTWARLNKTLTTRDLEQFIQHLDRWGHDHQCQLLLDYAKTLKDQLDNFDWDYIPQIVEQFPDLYNTFKHDSNA